MNRQLLKVASIVSTLTITASLLAACTPAGNNTTAAGTGTTTPGTTTGSIVKYNLGADPKTLDPALNTAVDGGTVLQNLYEGLMKTDENDQPIAGMAASHEVSADKLVYTFKLRDAKWSDGQPVKAGDFAYAWFRALDPNTKPAASEYSYQLFYIKNAEKFNKGEAKKEDVGIEVVDDKTLKVTLEAPCAYFLALMAFPTYFPVRQDMVEKDVNLWWDKKETHVSNGPFKFESHAQKATLVLKKNENYYNAANVKLDTIEMHLTDDAQTYLAAFKKGEVDMIESPPPQDIPAMIKDGTAKVLPYLGTYFYVINMRPELKEKNAAVYEALNKPQVRRALALAINKQQIVDNVSMGQQIPAWGYVPMGIKDDKGNNFAEAKKYLDKAEGDIAEAKKLLGEAGYPDGKGFPTITLKYNNSTGHQNIAVAVQAMWKQNLGIDVQLANEEWAVFQTSRINGDYEIARHGWIADYNDPMTFLDMWVSGQDNVAIWGNNDAHYDNPEYDKLIASAKIELDAAKRTQMLHDAEALLMNDLPIIPIYFYTNVVAYKDYVKGVRKSPLGFLFFENASIQK
ncbi:Oligopeptide-binding protein OppA [anaerobic digester metagenome]